MESNLTALEHYKREATDYLKEATGTKKRLFNLADTIKHRELGTRRIQVIIDSIDYLSKDPLRENDYFKFINCYYSEGIKLNDKYFRHDLDKLNEYYSKIDSNSYQGNPFSISNYQNYVLYMALKLNGVYETKDDLVFNVKVKDFREYSPLTKIPSVLRGTLPFEVKEYDIKKAFPSFIDIELGTDLRHGVYDKISKTDFAMLLNSNNESSISIHDARTGLETVYSELSHLIVTNERYNEKGRAFKDFAKYESEYINRFITDNDLKNFARLHDGIYLLKDTHCENLEFDKVVFTIKECIKPPIVNNTISFYQINNFGNVFTSPSMYADFLKQEKFIRIQSIDDKIQLLKDTNNVIDFYNHKTDMVTFLENEINEANKNAVRNAIARDNTNVLQQSFTLLKPVRLTYYKDTKTSFGLPFKNGFKYFDEFEKLDIKQKQYSDVSGFFSPHQIQTRDFQFLDEVGVFEKFIQRICTGVKDPDLTVYQNEIQAFNSMIGYLCHNFKSYTDSPCIVLTDEGANDETRNGGRGKTIIGTAIKEVTKTMEKGGNEFNGGYIHNFADLDESYNVYLLDDIPASFNFNDLYTNITGGINIQPKGSKGKMIEFRDTPKFLITTNWLFRYDENDTSTNRRFIEYKVKPYYSISLTPKDEFGHTFFEDWNQTEWNKFYSYIFKCVHFYLTNGIKRVQYDKTEDNYKALFGSDARESEMTRIMEKVIYSEPKIGNVEPNPVLSFNVSDFLQIYCDYNNPLKNEKMFTHVNTKRFIDIYLTKFTRIKYQYEPRSKRWIKCDG
jgi:hypothetical protein